MGCFLSNSIRRSASSISWFWNDNLGSVEDGVLKSGGATHGCGKDIFSRPMIYHLFSISLLRNVQEFGHLSLRVLVSHRSVSALPRDPLACDATVTQNAALCLFALSQSVDKATRMHSSLSMYKGRRCRKHTNRSL